MKNYSSNSMFKIKKDYPYNREKVFLRSIPLVLIPVSVVTIVMMSLLLLFSWSIPDAYEYLEIAYLTHLGIAFITVVLSATVPTLVLFLDKITGYKKRSNYSGVVLVLVSIVLTVVVIVSSDTHIYIYEKSKKEGVHSTVE